MTFKEKLISACTLKAKEVGRKLTGMEVVLLACELHGEKKKDPLTDEQWVASLEVEPSLSGVNIKQEIGKAQFWAKQNKRVVTRRFLTNWILKAERVVDLRAQGAQFATGLKIPAAPGPDGWEKQVEENMPLANDPAWGQVLAARNNHQFSMLPQSWQTKCRTNNFL